MSLMKNNFAKNLQNKKTSKRDLFMRESVTSIPPTGNLPG